MRRLFEKTFHSGEKWSAVIGRGKILRFTALDAGANTALMAYNSSDLTER